VVAQTLAADARALFGSRTRNIADTNIEMPTKAKAHWRLPVLSLIRPIAYGPAKPARLAMELMKAIPEAAAYPARNSLGKD